MERLSTFLTDKIIGISISDSEDLKPFGFSKAHLEDSKIEISRYLLSCGAVLMYGGDLRDKGFTRILFELVQSYKSDNSMEKKSLLNYLGWPIDFTLTVDLEAELKNQVEFVKTGLPKDIRKKLRPKNYLTPDSWEKYYIWYRSMSYMRQLMTLRNDARIALGGQSLKFKGKYPGVVEEIYLGIKAKKPMYLIGAYGGATRDVIDALQGKKPKRLNPEYHKKSQDLIEYFNQTKPSNVEDIDYLKLVKFFNTAGVSSLKNGLNSVENSQLFNTKHLPEITSLLLKGLLNKFG